jgi:small subunit ribosomal protein S3
MSAVKNVIKDNYNMMLLKDYLREAIKDAGFSHAEISKTPVGTRVALHVTRPGIVIGRKGSGIRALTDKLAADFGLKNPQISVVEIEKPELAPSVMCNRMASHLERGTAFRRATMWTLKQIMEGGAMGVQITISGKLRGDRSAFEKHTQGILPRAGHHAEIIVDEDIAHVKTAMGLIGVRIRIAKKEKLIPEFEMRTEKPTKSKQSKDGKTKVEKSKDVKIKVEEIEVEGAKVEVVKVEGKEDTAKSESERIALESKKMETLETLEEEEAKLK